MNKKHFVKLLSAVMSLVMLCGVFSQVMVSATSSNSYTSGLQTFLDDGNHTQLVDCPDAVYMEYVNQLRTNPKAELAMFALGLIYGGANYKAKIEPDKELYKQALLNIIRTYEVENADAITQQNLLDDTKSLEDYLRDVADIGLSWLGAVDTNIKIETGEGVIPEDVNLAVSIINQIPKDAEDWSKGACTLKTTLQLFEKHDIFLRTVEKNAEGALKEAASELRIDQSKVVKAHFRAYGDLAMDSAEDYAKLFIDGIWAEDWIDYIKDKLPLSIPKVFSRVFQGATLGVEIGKLVGNLSVGAEDVMAYIVEIKAVHDISIVLENELESTKNAFQMDNSKVTESDAQNYIIYGNYLISCRLRGQYCMTAIYLQPNLRNLILGDTAKNAESLYNRLSSNLLNIKKKLDAICESSNLGMFYLSISNGEYAISGDYKYLTVKNDNYGIEPTGDFYKVNIKTGEKILLKKNTVAQCINVVGDKVFYTLYDSVHTQYFSGLCNVGVHMMSTDGSDDRLLSDCFVTTLVADDTYVYFAEDGILNNNPKIKRISYNEGTSKEEVVVDNLKARVKHMGLLPGKLVYSDIITMVNSNCEVIVFDLKTRQKLRIDETVSSYEEYETKKHQLIYDNDIMWTHGEYVYFLKWNDLYYAPIKKENLEKHLKRVLVRYHVSTKTWELCTEIPMASYKQLPKPYDNGYIGVLNSNIEFIEEELPTDFAYSTKYVFSPIN